MWVNLRTNELFYSFSFRFRSHTMQIGMNVFATDITLVLPIHDSGLPTDLYGCSLGPIMKIKWINPSAFKIIFTQCLKHLPG
jgi:hypothetical protein